MNFNLNKALVIRTDRLGDCILSTPVFSAIKAVNKNAVIDVLTTPYTAPVFSGNPNINEVITDDPSGYGMFSSKFFELVKNISGRKYDVCFILHLTARAALTAFLAGIPARVSPASKIYQFLSTCRVGQKRSLCKANEAEYNLDLIRRPLEAGFENPPSELYLDKESESFAKNYLNEMILRQRDTSYESFKKSGRKLIMIHPGSGGSALNMSRALYAELMEKLYCKGFEIFLSTGPAEEELKEDFLSSLSFTPLYYKSEVFNSGGVLKNSFAMIASADAVIAPSTGILHAAVALRKPVVALFCPIFVCTPVRWGPYKPVGAEVIMPKSVSSEKSNIVNGGSCVKCIKSACTYYNCMDSIETDDIIEKLQSVLNSKK